MPDGRLFIGTRRYSSWSLRGWLAVRLAGLDVEEVVIPLAGGATAAVKAVSPGGTVPYLEHLGAAIWDSLAICEYCAEILPVLWPSERVARAHARTIAGEMHSGFRGLRTEMPMSLFRPRGGGASAGAPSGAPLGAMADVARIDAIWAETRGRFGEGGPYLFGAQFTAADAMFAPVVARMLTYRPGLSAVAEAYCTAVRAQPLVAAWYAAAAAEPRDWWLDQYERPV